MLSFTQILVFTFFCNSIFISSWFLMKKELTCVSEMTILHLHKNIIITLLCRSGLFINTCVSKKPVVFKDVIFYLLWYTWYAEAVIYAKNLLFFNSVVSEWSLVNNTGEVIEQNWQCVTKFNTGICFQYDSTMQFLGVKKWCTVNIFGSLSLVFVGFQTFC